MDGNKDEAIKCLKIGRDALDIGDRSRALKFISKARRLDPSLPVDDLLAKIQSTDAPIDNGSSKPNFDEVDSNSNSNSAPRRRNSASGSSSSSSSVAYSEEQVTIVREIKRKKDFYDILGLERSASVEDIRKAYRKLSLKVHPDKNKAPGAEEAFKMVSKSFMCLNDEESRRRYDVVGSDEVVYERRPARRNQGFNGFYDGDVDAEEIFRNFFFGGMNPGAATQFRGFAFGNGVNVRMGNHNGSAGASNTRALIQLLPVILFVLLSLWPSAEPVYSLNRSYPYQHAVSTQKGVDFYVKSRTFEQEYPTGSNEREELESRIEREYLSILSHNCQIERQRLQWGFLKEAPHCNALKQFQAAA